MKRKILLRNKKKVLRIGWAMYKNTFYSQYASLDERKVDYKMMMDLALFSSYRCKAVSTEQMCFGISRKSKVSMIIVHGWMYSRSSWEKYSGTTMLVGMLKPVEDKIEVFIHEKKVKVQK